MIRKLLLSLVIMILLTSCKKDKQDELNEPSIDESANYVVTTVAGNNMAGTTDGMGASARFNLPASVATDQQGNLYVADAANFSIRKITPAGMVSTLAGGQQGYADGTGSAAQFYNTIGITTDAAGNIYAADVTRIRRITPSGVVTTLAGTTTIGNADGIGASALFSFIGAIAMDQYGIIYVLDNSATGSLIRKITLAGEVTTFYSHNKLCSAIAVDTQGNVYINELGIILEDIIHKITPSKAITKFASIPPCGGMTINSQNLFYIIGFTTDFTHDYARVYKVNTAGKYTIIAGTTGGFADGDGNVAQFYAPRGVVADDSGNIFVADQENNRIRKIRSK